MSLQELIDEFIEPSKEVLDSFDIQETLNPKLWNNFELKVDVEEKILDITGEFLQSFDNYVYSMVSIDDIIIVGSSANYNWSKYSDVDVHIIITINCKDKNEKLLVKDFIDMKKIIWNDKHDIKIRGISVELYVQQFDEHNESSGVYSVVDKKWKKKPVKNKIEIDKEAVKQKATLYMEKIDKIENMVDSENYSYVLEAGKKLKEKIRNMRKSGLEKTGEYSIENLAFKVLRRNGYIKKLFELLDESYDMYYST
jgi:predicted nucleotidyltransferase